MLFRSRHLNGDEEYEEKQYDLLVNILKQGILGKSEKREVNWSYETQICHDDSYLPGIVCFCDIPREDLEIHMEKYSKFGLAFSKKFMITKGANPVFYVARNSVEYFGQHDNVGRDKIFNKQIAEGIYLLKEYRDMLLKSTRRKREKVNLPKIDNLAGFLFFHIYSFIKCYDEGLGHNDPDNYYMEREWRILGNLPFNIKDVVRIFLPESFGAKFRADIPEYTSELIFC